jgi:hypothetical protein
METAGKGRQAAQVKDPHARRLINEVVVRRGNSYADAISELERRGNLVRAPYQEAAEDKMLLTRNAIYAAWGTFLGSIGGLLLGAVLWA